MALQNAWLKQIRGWAGAAHGRSHEQLSVYVSRGAVASSVAHLDPRLGGSLVADPITEIGDVTEVLAGQISRLNASRLPCNLVLAPEFYSMQLIERPNVPEAELNEAVRWVLQDQVDFSVETAVLDTFPMPKGGSRHQHMSFAVALPQELLRLVVDHVSAAGIKRFNSIDVTELAMRNLTWRCFPMADQSVGLLRLTGNSGLINVSRGEDLYLSRRLAGVPGEFSEPSWQEFRERLLLQVQRSLDYYQSAMGQPECDMLMIACTHSWTARVTEYLAEMLPMPVRTIYDAMAGEVELTLFNPDRVEIDWQALDEDQANAICAGLLAFGGALRNKPSVQVAAA